MKFRVLALGMGMLFVSSIAQAVPFLYTFTGNIYSIEKNGIPTFSGSVDVGGSIFSIGESVEYVFNIDRTEQGFCTATNQSLGGCDFSETSLIPTNSADYFFSELVSATYGNGGSVPFDWKTAELKWGLESSLTGTQFNGGSSIAVLGLSPGIIPLFTDLASFDASPFSPITSLASGRQDWDESGNTGAILSILNLTSIVPVAIPTPSTLALFAAAFLILPFYKKNKRVKSQIT